MYLDAVEENEKNAAPSPAAPSPRDSDLTFHRKHDLPETQKDRSENLGVDPIGKLFLRLGLPMAFGMLMHGLYNLVDAYFVTRFVGENAMAGVSISLPIQMMLFAFAGLIGNGASTLVSQKLGAKKLQEAKAVSTNAVSLALGASIFITIIASVYLPELIAILGTSETHIPYVKAYLQPMIFGSVLVFLLSLVFDLLRAEAQVKPMLLMILCSTIANILLDALLIIKFDMGVSGAAVATILTQGLSLLIGLSFYCRGKTSLPLPLPSFKLDTSICKKIIALGSPLLIAYFGMSFLIASINASIAYSGHADSSAMITAYGILGRIHIFILLPAMALSSTTQTVVAYNFGANLSARVRKTLKLGMAITGIYLVTCMVIIISIPHYVISLFTSDATVLVVGSSIARMQFFCLPLAGISLIAIAYFQGIEKPKHAMALSAFRIYGLMLPLIFIIPRIWSVEFVWLALPASDAIAFIVILVLIYIKRESLKEKPLSNSSVAF